MYLVTVMSEDFPQTARRVHQELSICACNSLGDRSSCVGPKDMPGDIGHVLSLV